MEGWGPIKRIKGWLGKKTVLVLCFIILTTLTVGYIMAYRSGTTPAHPGRAEETCLRKAIEQSYEKGLYPRPRGVLQGAYSQCLVVTKDGDILNIWGERENRPGNRIR